MADIKTWNSDANGKFLRNVERVVQLIYDLQEEGIPAKLELEVAGYDIKNLKIERRYPREADEMLLRKNLRGSFTVLFQDSKVSGYLQRETFAPID